MQGKRVIIRQIFCNHDFIRPENMVGFRLTTAKLWMEWRAQLSRGVRVGDCGRGNISRGVVGRNFGVAESSLGELRGNHWDSFKQIKVTDKRAPKKSFNKSFSDYLIKSLYMLPAI